MLYQNTLRKIVAGLLLFIFAFSITPQKTWHDVVAKHSDPTHCSVHKDLPIAQVEKSTLHCSYDNLVVASPFIYYCFELEPVFLGKARLINTPFTSFYYSPSYFKEDSRGPPATCS